MRLPYSSVESGSRDGAKDWEFARQSTLYQQFLAEREEILKHKWIESEKAGRDIGFEHALVDWVRKHREGWRTAWRHDHLQGGST